MTPPPDAKGRRKRRRKKSRKLFAVLEFIQMVAADSVEEVRERLPEKRRFKVEEMKP